MLNQIRTLVLGGAGAAGLPGIAADRAAAATTAQVANGVLTVTGDKAGDKVALSLASPTALAIDVGEDGTADFTFDRSTFGAVNVFADGGDDEVRLLNGTGLVGVPFMVDG